MRFSDSPPKNKAAGRSDRGLEEFLAAFINNHDERFAREIVRANSSSAQDRDSHRLEIVWRDAMDFRGRFFAFARFGLTGDAKVFLRAKSAERDVAINGSGLDAGQRRNLVEQLLIKRVAWSAVRGGARARRQSQPSGDGLDRSQAARFAARMSGRAGRQP